MHVIIDVIGDVVVSTAVLTSIIATWSLLPRPQRIVRMFR
jgi:hypothetical protein